MLIILIIFSYILLGIISFFLYKCFYKINIYIKSLYYNVLFFDEDEWGMNSFYFTHFFYMSIVF